MGTIHIGCVGFPVPPARYARRLSFVELAEPFQNIPRKKTLEKLRREAGEGMVFALRAHHRITHPAGAPIYRQQPALSAAERAGVGLFQDTPFVRQAYEKTLAAAEALEAAALVFETPLEFTPTRENRGRLLRFFKEIERGGRVMAWEPHGPWEREDALELAKEAGLVLAYDPLTPTGFEEEESAAPEGEIAYFRLRGPSGRRRRYAPFELEDLLDLAMGYRTAFVSFSHGGAYSDAAALRALLAAAERAPQEGIELPPEEE